MCTIPPKPNIVTNQVQDAPPISCKACTKMIDEIASTIDMSVMKELIQDQCQAMMKSIYNLTDDTFCLFISRFLDFVKKFGPSFICRLADVCSYEEVKSFHEGKWKNFTLGCEDCKNSVSSLKELLTTILKDYEIPITFAMNSIFGSRHPAELLMMNDDALANAVEAIFALQNISNICPSCEIALTPTATLEPPEPTQQPSPAITAINLTELTLPHASPSTASPTVVLVTKEPYMFLLNIGQQTQG